MIAGCDISVRWRVPWIARYYIQIGERLTRRIMSTTPANSQSSAARTRRHRERRRQGTRCVTVDVNQSELDALVVRGYLPVLERGSGAALKKAVEAVLSDIELDLQYETAERSRTRI
jgi:hypothetical protein